MTDIQAWVDADPVRKLIYGMTEEKMDAMTPEQFAEYMDLLLAETDRHLERTTPAQRVRWFLTSPTVPLTWALDYGLKLVGLLRYLEPRHGYTIDGRTHYRAPGDPKLMGERYVTKWWLSDRPEYGQGRNRKWREKRARHLRSLIAAFGRLDDAIWKVRRGR